MEVEPDGGVAVYVGSSSVGQGIETVMAQIAADALELPFERIRIQHGSTSYLREGFGSYGSRATVMGGCAIVLAAEALLAKFRAAAARKLGVAEGDLEVVDGVARAADGRTLALGEVEALAAEGTFSNSKSTYTYGTAIAHVAVDAKTGQVEVVDYTVVDDVGRIVNPLTLHGQVIGAAVKGSAASSPRRSPMTRTGSSLSARLPTT